MSDLAEMQTIRAIEAELAAPHQLRCFEAFAEVAVEIGLSTEGAFDEILDDGRNLMAHFHSHVEAVGSDDCQCDLPIEE